MATARNVERRLLDAGELELVEQTRQSALLQLDDKQVDDLLRLLRERRDRAQALANRQRRAVRGKERGKERTTFEKADAGNRQKAGILAEAVQRASKERSRRRASKARDSLVGSARRALALKRANAKRVAKASPKPPSSPTPDTGMAVQENTRVERIGSPMEAGRVSQFVRNAQAKRDSQ